MAYFKWFNKNQHGYIHAKNIYYAKAKLLQQKITADKIIKISFYQRLNNQKIKNEHFYQFFYQLKLLYQAKIYLSECITLLIKSNHKMVRMIAKTVSHDINQGKSFYQSLLAYKKYLPSWILICIKIGEECGTRGNQLSVINHYFDNKLTIRKKLKKALSYPLFVIIASIAACFLFLKISLPQISSFYHEASQALPWPTQLLLGINHYLNQFGLILLALSISLITLLIISFRYSLRFRYGMQRLLLSIPFIKKQAFASFCQAYASMLEAGIMFIDCCQNLHDNNQLLPIKHLLWDVQTSIHDGHSIYESFAQHSIIPNFFLTLINIGESNGQLAQSFQSLSHYFQAQADNFISQLDKKLEPLIMLLLAAIIGFIMLALYLPMINLSHAI